jgi:arabinose-5-phosphate isomerase
MLAVGDALAIVLLEARGFKREDFAKLHPGGAIGRALLLRVADIMRAGDRLAAVPVAGYMLKDAILAMTRARSGSQWGWWTTRGGRREFSPTAICGG